MFLVSGSLRFSGDLLLQGIPDHPGAPGSWVMLPLLQLTDTGSLQFQVGVCANSCNRRACSCICISRAGAVVLGCAGMASCIVCNLILQKAATDDLGHN